MVTEVERKCCQEIDQVTTKLAEAAVFTGQPAPTCITQHPGFRSVCLDVWVLQTAWHQYVKEYGRRAFEGPQDAKWRYVAYRQLARWCWDFWDVMSVWYCQHVL